VTGISGGITQTTTVTVTVNAPATPGTFTLSSSAAALSLSPGATTGNSTTISVLGSGGFAGTVALTCSVAAPAGAIDPATCGFSSNSLTPAQTSTLTITTTLPAASPYVAFHQNRKLFWPSTGGAALAALFFFCVPRRRQSWKAMLVLLVLLVSVGAIGCGQGGGGNTGGTTGGTTAGTYTVTVTGTSGSLAPQTTTVTVTVN
jgi:hypothetical protein